MPYHFIKVKKDSLRMFRKLKIKSKILIIGCLLVVIPQLIATTLTLIQNRFVLDNTVKETTKLTYTDLDHLVESVYGLVQSHQDVNQINIKNSLKVAHEVVANRGGFSFDEQTVRWDAVNQFSFATSAIELPRMKVGYSWLGQESRPRANVLVVDQVRDLVGVTCTVFQRMNASGDMLRVATNVIKNDGTRAISTYIPSIQPDGKRNPVIATVLNGETFVGKAYVVDAQYITAYEAIRDAGNNIIGMLYVGIPLERVESLRQTILNIVVGKTGYVWVLDSEGNYVISQRGQRDGENIFNSRDEQGNLFIREMIKKARALKPGEIAEHHYYWKNPGDPKERIKVARLVYFEPWDWIVGASSTEDEFLESTNKLKTAAMRSTFLLLGILIVSLITAIWVWVIVARQITVPIVKLIDATERMSKGELDIQIDTTAKDEIGSLARAINRMQTSLKLAMSRLRKEK
jgi:methyl-accepting chemotaxis protein